MFPPLAEPLLLSPQPASTSAASDATGPLLGVGGVNVTIPQGAAVWAPSDLTPTVAEGAAAPRYQITVYDEAGAAAYASGAREGGTTRISAAAR